MLFIRDSLLGILIALHVIGGAALFRRYFPRESPWWGFFVPTLALVSLLNFIEHFVALPALEWVLPISSAGLIWVMADKRTPWKKMALPTGLFAALFAFTLTVKCLEPEVNFWCTEGLTDMNRILDFCLGDKVPPRDCWLPPYPHTGYYTFMQYGGSVLKRLLNVDIGTAYNLSSALVSALTMLATAAAAHSISRYRAWVAIVTALVMAGGFTGSTPIHVLLHPNDPAPYASIDLGFPGDDGRVMKEFNYFLDKVPSSIAYRLYTPGCYIYYSEFHATMAGHLLGLLAVFGVAEVFRRKRAIIPWIYLLIVPILALISCTWFVITIGPMAYPAMALAWLAGRRPTKWRYVLMGAIGMLALLWPTLNAMCHNSPKEYCYWSDDVRNDFWTVVIQWWPVYIPWIALCFAWPRMTLAMRWLHFVLLPTFILVEAFYFTDRGTTLEKTWGGVFGLGVAILYPILFVQKGWIYRGLSAVLVLTGLLCLGAWATGVWESADWPETALRLEGDYHLHNDPEPARMFEVMSRIRGQTVLTGVAPRAFYRAPSLAAFTENRCYLGWTNAEETCGHVEEAHMRQANENAFYDGSMTDPLAFLETNGISAVLVWPEDKRSDDWLEKMKTALTSDFTYYDCKVENEPNAGIFIRRSVLSN